MRHAESEERRGVRDHDRAITERGAATARQVRCAAQHGSAAFNQARSLPLLLLRLLLQLSACTRCCLTCGQQVRAPSAMQLAA